MTHLIVEKITVNFYEVRLIEATAERWANIGFAVCSDEQPKAEQNGQTQRILSALPHCLWKPKYGISFVFHFYLHNELKLDSSKRSLVAFSRFFFKSLSHLFIFEPNS